ncbi:MAG: beta-ketoacyl synthase N-terminal-like domain-containing protein, partial [Gemmataceae bacterium]
MPSNNRVAIVGIGGLFSKSLTLEQFWNNIVTGTDTSTEIPAGRWPLPSESIFDSTVGRTDTVYSTRGYFIENWQFDPSLHDLDPSFLADLDPLFHITLQVGRQAWEDCRTDALDRGRCGVILGSLCLPTDGASAFAEHFVGNTILEQLGADIPPGAAHPPPESCHPAGLPSELLARSLGLEGTCFTLDAACASSLYAIKLAVDKLLSGAADAIIAGGVSRPDCLYTQMGFSQLRALSPTGKCSPFDVKADGLVVGEGGAMFVLKRLQDAVQQGDYIYGVLAGVGLSNDTQGNVLAPDSAGQLRAMRLAYEQAGWRPNEVDYIECHATGTALGDGVELRSLTQLWEGCSPHTCALGSVKANVGHTLTAAGAAGLLKVLLAIKHQTLPPATNLESPLLQLQEDKQSWTLLRDGQTWEQRQSDIPRRAAVSAFGFGGINAHLLIEEWIADQGTNTFAITTRPRYPVPLAIVGVHAALDNSPDLDAVRASWFSNEQQEKNSESTFRWWGVEEATWLQGFLHSGETRHTSLDQVKVPRTAFRIPPSDLQEMLPQQLLMLNVARRALQDVLGNTGEKTRTGVFIGLGLDPNTTNFHLRWWFKRTLEQSRKVTDTSSTQETLNRLQDSLDSIHPPLTAGRTLGALASITASRISREFGLGGPSFTITSPTDSGADALETARQLLENNEIDTAVVGAVDFPSDVRATIARHLSSNPDLAESRPSEGAIAFVLKRFEDAQQAEDHIYAVLENETADRHDPQSSLKVSHPPNLSSTKFGHLGYLVNLLRGTLAVAETRVPRSVEHQGGLSHYWFQDTADGFRSVVVGVPPPRSNEATRLVMSHSQQPWTSLRPSQLPLPEGLFVVRATHQSQFPDRLKELQSFVDQSPASSIDQLARHWHQYHSRGPEQLLCTFVVPTREDLTALLDQRLRSLSSGADDRHDRFQPQLRTQSFSTLDHKVISKGKLGLVFAGSGNWHPGMGRELFLHWPQSLERQEADNQWLRSQYRPEVFWEREDLEGVETRKLLMGQVAYGTGVSDLLELFGVRPDAAIGYSLGETTLLFATRIWQDRDTMLHRLMQSPLFHSDLCGDYQAARQYWQLSKDEDVDWIAGIVPCQPAEVSRALQDVPRAYLLIKNSDSECVIGGHRRSVDQVVSRLRCGFLPTAAQSSVHCPIVRVVEDRYRRLHTLPVTSTPTIAIYSGARGAVYTPSLVSAAHAVTSQALETLDFPRVIQQAYEDGVRTFLEVGPGQNCTRLIGQILRDRPHLAVGINSPREGEVQGFLRVLAQLISNGHNINLDPLYGPARSSANDVSSLEIDTLSIHVPVGHLAPTLPAVSKEVARALVMVAHPPNQSTLKSSCTFAKQPDVADVTPSVPLSDKQDADVTLPVPATSSTQFSTNTQPRHSHWTTMHPDHTPEPRTYSQPFQALLSNGTGHHSPDWLQTYASLLRQRGEAHQSYLAFADRAQKALSSYMTSPIVPSLVKKTPPPAVSAPEMV